MITYELAKQLKEAHFPQLLENRIHYRLFCEECMSNNFEKPMKLDMLDEFDIAIPTLSELIEGCGYGFRSLSNHSDGRWIAKSGAKSTFGKSKLFSGHSPEEAVAKLWLELNR